MVQIHLHGVTLSARARKRHLGVARAARVVWVRREAPTVDVPCTDGQHHTYVPPQVAGADAVEGEPRSAPPLGHSTHEEDGETDAVWWGWGARARVAARVEVMGEGEG